jgi:hypothetical protein
MAEVGPHDFVPLRRWFNRGRCLHCFVHECFHPVRGWAVARPVGDKALPGSPSAVARGGSRIEA